MLGLDNSAKTPYQPIFWHCLGAFLQYLTIFSTKSGLKTAKIGDLFDIPISRESINLFALLILRLSIFFFGNIRQFISNSNTGHSRYVDFAYLDTTAYVEVIFHSQIFFSIFLCISTPSMSKTGNMKQRVSRGDFSCPRRILYYICYCLCRSKDRRSHGRHIVCFGYVHVLAEVRTSSKQQ